MDLAIENTTAAVVGAAGTIGRVCAALLADKVKQLYLIGRQQAPLDELRQELESQGVRAAVHTTTDINAVKNAQLILTVTSDLHAVIQPEHLQPGSVICDVARPRDVSAQVAAARDDVLVIDGGMVDVPGPVNFNFDFGFPPGKAYACMAETIALALEGRFEDFTLGKQISRQQVEEIDQIARKHGFSLSGFRSFEKAVTEEQIEKVRLRAHAAHQQN
jgi:predicted amino acid dehydrogenase